MIDLLLLLPTGVLGFLLWWEKRDRAIERKAWELERIGLIQRIQAPQAVIHKYEADNNISEEPLYVSPEVDSEWDEYREAVEAGEAR